MLTLTRHDWRGGSTSTATDLRGFRWPLSSILGDQNWERMLVDVNGRSATPETVCGDGDHVEYAVLPAGVAPLFAPFVVGQWLLNKGIAEASRALADRPPKQPTREEDSPTVQFSGRQNTVGAGVPIPIVFGELRVAGHIIETYTDVRFDQLAADSEIITAIGQTSETEVVARRLNTRIVVSHGPVESITAIEIDDNPIEDIPGILYQTILGAEDQKHAVGFDETKSTLSVETTVPQASPQTKTTSNEVTALEVELSFGQGLYEFTSDGQLQTREVEVKIEYRPDATGSYTDAGTFTISGATRSPKSWWIRFENLAQRIYQVQVTRVTADNVDPNIQDEFRFESLVEAVEGARAHPGLAQFAVRQVPQEQSRTPGSYSAIVKGINRIRQYTTTSSYTRGWTDNPAWCCLWFICSKRHGLGKYYDYDSLSDSMLQSFIDWAAHCDEIVDGQRRCTFNYALDTRQRGVDVLNIFTRGSDAFLVEEGGEFRVVIDEAAPVSRYYTEARYERESLEYTLLSPDTLGSRITAEFLNEDQDYERDALIIHDDTVGDGVDFVDETLELYGVTRIRQIERQIQKFLASNRLQRRVASFECGVSSIGLKAGDVIGLASITGKIGIGNGRVREISGDARKIRLDRQVTLATGTTYEVTLIYDASGAVDVQEVTADLLDSPTDWISLARTDTTLSPGDQYSIGAVDSTIEKFRVVETSLGDSLRRKVTAVYYDPDVYTQTITAVSDSAPRTVKSDLFPGAVTNLQLVEREPQTAAADSVKVIDVSWTLPTATTATSAVAISHYEIWRRISTQLYRFEGQSVGQSFTIADSVAPSTTYEVAVIAVSPSGKKRAVQNATSTTITTTA